MASSWASRGSGERASGSKKASWRSGEAVLVRATRCKWMQGQVKRLARGGVIIWVEEARVVVHVPLQLAASHLSSLSSPALPAAPMSPATLLRLPTCQDGRLLVVAVRPAHLSHRLLFQRAALKLPLPLVTVPAPQTQGASHGRHEMARVDHETALSGFDDRHSQPAAADDALHNSPQADPVLAAGNGETPTVNHHSLPSGMHTEATPDRARSAESPPSSPASSTSQRALKLLESIPESSDSSNMGTAPEAEEAAKTTAAGGRFSGPYLEVPHPCIADNCASTSSSSSAATTPSPADRQTLADRMRKLKLPASGKTSPSSQREKGPSNSQSESLQGTWITLIQDGKCQRFATTEGVDSQALPI